MRRYQSDVLDELFAKHAEPYDAQKSVADLRVLFKIPFFFGASRLGITSAVCSNLGKLGFVRVDASDPRDNIYMYDGKSFNFSTCYQAIAICSGVVASDSCN